MLATVIIIFVHTSNNNHYMQEFQMTPEQKPGTARLSELVLEPDPEPPVSLSQF